MEENNYSIYIHINKFNSKVYIGKSNNVTRRWRNNGIEYKPSKGENQNRPFWNAINKYGWNNFEHEILHDNLTDAESSVKEIELINKYNSTNKEYGYNISLGGNGGKIYLTHPKGMLGKHHSKSFKIEQSKRTKKLNEEGKMGAVWLNGHPKGMLGKKHSEECKKNISKKMKGRIFSQETIEKMKISNKYNNNKKVINIESKIIYRSMVYASDTLHICKTSIGKCCNRKQKTAGGYHWMYYDDYLKLHNETEELEKVIHI